MLIDKFDKTLKVASDHSVEISTSGVVVMETMIVVSTLLVGGLQ